VGKMYTREELVALAKQAAQEVGVEVLRWWQNEGDPRELYIDAKTKDGKIPVLLVAILPE